MSTPAPIPSAAFAEFFRALWGYDPFPWQVDFCARVCAGGTPDYVTVPTGSGKTACLDGAVFALAVQAACPPIERTVGRRIFFIVNRRIIVDEAFERAKTLSKKLKEAGSQYPAAKGIVAQVAYWLRQVTGETDADPLACTELRGGIYRDRAWAKSLTQPMILCSTVDQAGSRLLFRGYGVTAEARPIHAALVAHDSLLLIDEAHISQPFLETLQWVKKYRAFQPPGSEPVTLPFSIVRMTATPPRDEENTTRVELTEADREHPVLKPRLEIAKHARLLPAPDAKGKAWNEKLAKKLADQADELTKEPKLRSLAIMVNRVATARAVYSAVKKKHTGANVTLLLGRMRPFDRDKVTKRLQAVLKTGHQSDGAETPLEIVVSTQCLEVGADFDFDALVTECASLDALRQRFGRLNRGGRSINAQAIIVFPEESKKETPPDPIYGNAILRTWEWLNSRAENDHVNFSLKEMGAAVAALRESDEAAFAAMLTPVGRAPVMLPAYLDCWVQTNPGPAADPDVAIFLHGPQRDMAEVQVCWRADLPSPSPENEQAWAETLALCAPTTLECLPVPLHVFRQWLESGGKPPDDLSGDTPQTTAEEDSGRRSPSISVTAMIWRGADESSFIKKSGDIRPGDTLVLRAQEGGWTALGHLPDAPDELTQNIERVDCAEESQAVIRRRAIVRIHPAVWHSGAKDAPAWQLLEWAKNTEFDWRNKGTRDEVRQALYAAADAATESDLGFSKRLRHLAKEVTRLDVERYPDDAGVVLSVRALLQINTEATESISPDDGPDDPLLDTPVPQRLDEHTQQVVALAARYSVALGIKSFADALTKAATLHDLGKADRRFQALLIGSDVSAALAQPFLWAKSASIPTSAIARKRVSECATLPAGFRHEMLSTQLASLPVAVALLPDEEKRRLLSLHLIAGHHGHARPFAPVVEDAAPPPVMVPVADLKLTMNSTERLTQPSHAIDSGIAERFWQLTRLHGWWGLALLEAVLRLADQTASATYPHEK